MYILLDQNGYEFLTTDTLTYIKYGDNGCLTFASESDADGIVIDSTPYNTQKHNGISGAQVLTVLEKSDDGVPRKGLADSVLTKVSDNDYDMEWRKVGGLASDLNSSVWYDFMSVLSVYRMGNDEWSSEEMDAVKWFTEKYNLNYDVVLRSSPDGALFTCTWQKFLDRMYSLLDDIECTDDRGASFFDWQANEINMSWAQLAFFIAHGWESWPYTETPDDATIDAEAKTYTWRWQGSGRVTNPYVMKDGTTMYLWNSLTKKWDKA